MKRILISVAATVACVVPFAMHAQNALASYKIPFTFNAEGVQMSPGKYVLSGIRESSAMLRGDDQGVMFIMTGVLSGEPGRSHLTFDKCGDRYFLRQVWNSNGAGTNIPVSAEEREIMNAQLQAKVTPTEVVLLAQR